METMDVQVMESKVDRWVQRVSLVTMVALALSLLAVGVALYSPRVEAGSSRELPLGR